MIDILPVAFFILGAILASFAGVVAERSFTGQAWHSGRSRCDACARVLTMFDLVPVVSWVLAGGKCRTCRARIPGSYALAELLLGLAFVFSYARLGLTFALVPFLIALVVLTAIVFYDLRHMVVPVPFSAWFIALGVAYLGLSFTTVAVLYTTLALAAGIALFFFLLYAVSGGRAMGLGDTPVAFGLALLTGSAALAGLAFSFWIGAGVGIIMLWGRPKGHRMGIEVPLVPFLALGFLLAYFTQWNPFPIFGF
ncbi:MAG TPA: prepilin peptidase [Candidatus Paceibacterota bacterium]|nr:prepilin peptidase [Candidatus Paceibacterota bacterium]